MLFLNWHIYYHMCQIKTSEFKFAKFRNVIPSFFQKRLSEFVDDLQYERKTWLTIMMLLTTMTLFVLPYCLIYLISLNKQSSTLQENTAVLYYMNLLPYVKYATDPLIYGKRMLGLQEELQKRLKKHCCFNLKERNRSSTARENCTKKDNIHQMVTLVWLNLMSCCRLGCNTFRAIHDQAIKVSRNSSWAGKFAWFVQFPLFCQNQGFLYFISLNVYSLNFFLEYFNIWDQFLVLEVRIMSFRKIRQLMKTCQTLFRKPLNKSLYNTFCHIGPKKWRFKSA